MENNMQYTNWEYYTRFYAEIADKETFDRLCAKAEMKMDVFTHMRASCFIKNHRKTYATDFQKRVYMQILNTVCELVNAMYVQETSGMGTGVASVSNDGYSESYRITTEAEKEAQLFSIVRAGLAGTGLMGVL